MNNKTFHRGAFKQVPIYTGKFFRMFIYMNDWKTLPMAGLIAGVVCMVIGKRIFVTMEGTELGALALACVCLWNGCFNSIQVVCRERGIIKREHRAGMKIPAYVASHMIYQATLCMLQSIIIYFICFFMKLNLPEQGVITPYFSLDFIISMFLMTYASDMMALTISCIAKNTTAAMIAMPFVLVVQLVLSGAIFPLSGIVAKLGNLTLAKWGVIEMNSLGGTNNLPMVSIWNQLTKMQDVEFMGVKPIKTILEQIESAGMKEEFELSVGSLNADARYVTSPEVITRCWIILIAFVFVFAFICMLALRRVDKDKR